MSKRTEDDLELVVRKNAARTTSGCVEKTAGARTAVLALAALGSGAPAAVLGGEGEAGPPPDGEGGLAGGEGRPAAEVDVCQLHLGVLAHRVFAVEVRHVLVRLAAQTRAVAAVFVIEARGRPAGPTTTEIRM